MIQFPDTLESTSPQEYGIAKAKQIIGHKQVATMGELFSLPDAILSDTKNNNNNDAIGQQWYVFEKGKTYQLVNWEKRKTSEGWAIVGAGKTNPTSGGVMFGFEGNIASGANSFSSGDNTLASGNASTAIGRGARAIGDYSTAIGGAYFLLKIHYIAPNKCRTYYMGYSIYSEEELLYSYVYKKTNLRERLAQIIKVEGDIITLDRDYLTPDMTEIAVDGGVASGHSSVAIGGGHAMGQDGFAAGKNSLAKGKYSTSFGEDTQAIGNGSIAEGNRTMAEGTYSHTEGMLTVAKGNGSHAEGGGCVGIYLKGAANATEYLVQDDYDEYESLILVDGAYILTNYGNHEKEGKTSQIVSHRVDENGKYHITVDRTFNETEDVDDLRDNEIHALTLGAYGMGSHTEGEALALGRFSHAEGVDNVSKGNNSHAENHGTRAIGHQSHAEGYRTVALNDNEHAQGKYNLSHSEKTIHSIGIGADKNTRKNAVEVLNDGKVYIKDIGNYNGTNIDTALTLQEVVNSGGGSSTINIIDNLNSSSTTSALSANQGRILKQQVDTNEYAISTWAQSDFEIISTEFDITIKLTKPGAQGGFSPISFTIPTTEDTKIEAGLLSKELYNEIRDTIDVTLPTKQPMLVSGESIKTINGESLLGKGNISISGEGKVASVNGKTGEVILSGADIKIQVNGGRNQLLNYWAKYIEEEINLTNEMVLTTQKKLVSGTNIKTINGQSILGEGDLSVNTNIVAFKEIVKNVQTESNSSSSQDLDIVYDEGVNKFLAKENVLMGTPKYYNTALYYPIADTKPKVCQFYTCKDRVFIGVSNGLCELFKTELI